MTDVTLREHIESQISWLDRHVESQLKQIDINTIKALAQLDKRLEGMNEFRDSLNDQSARFITRAEYVASHEALENRMKSVELTRAAGEGRALIVSGFVAFIASILIAIISHWFIK